MLYIVLPAYNEERDIGALLKRIPEAMASLEFDYKVLVVNDGSTDGTVSVVSSFAHKVPLELLDHGKNKGLGQAILTGLRRASALVADDDIIVTMDADNTHDPKLIEDMVERIRAGKDVVIASRYKEGGEEIGVSWLRHVFSWGASFLLRLFFPIKGVKDYTCGYRAYRGAVLHQAWDVYHDRFIEESGFTCMAEILIKLCRLPVQFDEVPLILRYDSKSGRSKMKILLTTSRYLALIARNSLLSKSDSEPQLAR
jgi:dolichol-phosphate mannosyltransferase